MLSLLLQTLARIGLTIEVIVRDNGEIAVDPLVTCNAIVLPVRSPSIPFTVVLPTRWMSMNEATCPEGGNKHCAEHIHRS